jgi:hypothetical protein
VQERRGAPRHRCRLRCVASRGGIRDEAIVRDLSLSGLSILTSLELGQGDGVDVEIEGGIRVQALAWRVRRAAEGHLVGLMLSEVGPGYEALVAQAAGAKPATPPPKAGPTAPPPPAAAPPAQAGGCTWWSLRVKESGGSRTRSIKLAAAHRDEAIAHALAELGHGWTILTIEAARSPA